MKRLPLQQRLRRAWRELTGSATAVYKGAAGGRLLSDWSPTLLNANDEIRWSLPFLRARARELARNNPYARQYLNLLSSNVIGPTGVSYQGQVRDNSGQLNARINDTLESAWSEWSQVATLDGRWSRVALEQQLIETVARDGEAFVRIWRGAELNRFAFALEPIDPDMVDDRLNRPAEGGVNEIRMGVEVDSRGRPVAYHLRERSGGLIGTARGGKPERVPADEILHLGRPTRVNQTRFVTWFAPVMLPMHMLGGYTEAELVAARTAAAKMGFFTRKDDGGSPTPAGDEERNEILMDASPGSFEFAPEGFELTPWAPDHPSTAFPTFVKAMLREVATGLGVSYNALANDLENVNYSSIRSGLLIERDLWRVLQNWWIGAVQRPLFREWLNAALLSGAIRFDTRDPRKFLDAKWTPRGWAWVDPLKDVQAAVIAIQTGLGSRTEYLAEQGGDPEEILDELAKEQELAEAAGIDISGPKSPAPAQAPEPDDEPAAKAEEDAAAESARGRARPEVIAALANGRRHVNGTGAKPAAAPRPSEPRRTS